MQTNRLKHAKDVSNLLKILSTPRRLLLVCLLMNSERCVNELMDELGTSLGNISQHINVLEKAGIIKKRREGIFIFCSIADPKIKKLIKTLHELYCPRLF